MTFAAHRITLKTMAFFQAPPTLKNQLDDDALLREYLDRQVPADVRTAWHEELHHLGDLAGDALYRAHLNDRLQLPQLTQWDAWGQRVDEITLTPLWHRAHVLAAEHGLVATAYDGQFGRYDRVFQFAKNYVIQPSLDFYSCPLAMTDGAARTLLDSGHATVIARAIPHLTSRNPARFWTSGQWMTERTGGSDVGQSETEARPIGEGGEDYALHGTKWFTSAASSQMAIALARPVGNPPGGRGLALFYIETRTEDGRLNGLRIERLKDKLGTRKVPTAELTLDGCRAIAFRGTGHGTRHIAPMLNITRVWNAMAAAWGARRGLALARNYAAKRTAFGSPLSEKPLHVDTLAGAAAETEAIFHLAFRAAELLGRVEHGEADEHEQALLRTLTPIAKLTTGKQAVAIASETLEAFGGAGYVEDTGLPVLLRDAQVLPIWEGTTDVLSLDTLRALNDKACGAALAAEIRRAASQSTAPALEGCVVKLTRAVERAQTWLLSTAGQSALLEAGARRYAMTLGRCLQLAYLCQHAQWCIDHDRGARAVAAARRFASHGVDRIDPDLDPRDSRALAEGHA